MSWWHSRRELCATKPSRPAASVSSIQTLGTRNTHHDASLATLAPMLPVQSIEELLSVAYVSAVVARSGFVPSSVQHDFGVDLSVRRIGAFGNRRIDLGAFLDLQLKASVSWSLTDEHLAFDLEADAYNRLILRRENAATPCALVVCCLPRDDSAWLNVNEEALVLKKCCYYHFLSGPQTTNGRSRRIHIPRSQTLTPQSLREIDSAIKAGATL